MKCKLTGTIFGDLEALVENLSKLKPFFSLPWVFNPLCSVSINMSLLISIDKIRKLISTLMCRVNVWYTARMPESNPPRCRKEEIERCFILIQNTCEPNNTKINLHGLCAGEWARSIWSQKAWKVKQQTAYVLLVLLIENPSKISQLDWIEFNQASKKIVKLRQCINGHSRNGRLKKKFNTNSQHENLTWFGWIKWIWVRWQKFV